MLVVLLAPGIAGCESFGTPEAQPNPAAHLPLPPPLPARLRAARRGITPAEMAANGTIEAPPAPEANGAAQSDQPTAADQPAPAGQAAPDADAEAEAGAMTARMPAAGSAPDQPVASLAPAVPQSAPAFRSPIGMTAAALRARFGPPAGERVAGPARIWRYPGRDCVAELTLYYDLQRGAFVAVEQRHEGNAPSPEACLASRGNPASTG
ncbi:MAG: hypothetical protein IT557_05835 [Alphaproteobacteria bacterium]|nr:hypothetical protein [Alphaproteobacteria bacterium]